MPAAFDTLFAPRPNALPFLAASRVLFLLSAMRRQPQATEHKAIQRLERNEQARLRMAQKRAELKSRPFEEQALVAQRNRAYQATYREKKRQELAQREADRRCRLYLERFGPDAYESYLRQRRERKGKMRANRHEGAGDASPAEASQAEAAEGVSDSSPSTNSSLSLPASSPSPDRPLSPAFTPSDGSARPSRQVLVPSPPPDRAWMPSVRSYPPSPGLGRPAGTPLPSSPPLALSPPRDWMPSAPSYAPSESLGPPHFHLPAATAPASASRRPRVPALTVAPSPPPRHCNQMPSISASSANPAYPRLPPMRAVPPPTPAPAAGASRPQMTARPDPLEPSPERWQFALQPIAPVRRSWAP
ncbi:hypothetical protein GGX14DRAFT_654054 [Mycena pura]|uniref:Uncharacterized protein n=1 Tax=Mycena pura TaxID=153505 RepID=A0AAD6YCE5_9AGAR|nr:hypothetical protein GGX14DRAFT_654054 [Mycena pura]